jgi:putative phosphonate metabolism protein
MSACHRYAIYVVPEGAFYRAGAAWLGWDSLAGQAVAHPELPGLPMPVADMTATPRKYGLHGTVKPPFRLADGMTEAALRDATAALCARLAPVDVPTLALRQLGGFVAVVPDAPCARLADLAAETVTTLDTFRAPPGDAELAKRRKPGLSAPQEALLRQWGYPYVLDEFRFHLTLTGKLGAAAWPAAERLRSHFAPVLPQPFRVGSLCLMGEDGAGRFHVLHRYALSG